MNTVYFFTAFILQRALIPTLRLFFKIFLRTSVSGSKNLKGIKGHIIFAANHTSEFDAILIPVSLPYFANFAPLFYVARERRFYRRFSWRRYIYGGVFFKLFGAFPIISHLHNYELALASHVALLKNGKNLCIFPEGAITKDGHIGEAHGGIGYLAYATDATIVPIAIEGLFHMNASDFWKRKRKVTIRIGTPIVSKELFTMNTPSVDDFKLAATHILKKIISLQEKQIEIPVVGQVKAQESLAAGI